MAVTYRAVQVAGISGRGGPSLVQDSDRLLVFGGADREGKLFNDVIAVQTSATSSGTSRTCKLSIVNADGESMDSRSGLRLPGIGGHAAATIALGPHRCPAMVTFGGIDFVEQRVSSALFECRCEQAASGAAGGSAASAHGPARWRALGAAPSDDASKPAKGKGKAGPVLGEPRLVSGDSLPGGRTGHSMSTVPPPKVLPATVPRTAAQEAQAPVPLWTVPGFTGPIPASALPAGVSADPSSTGTVHAGWCIMACGSSPEQGPLNDVWALWATEPADQASEPVDAQYSWLELEASGPQPVRRELHSAWVRPAVVQFCSDDSSGQALTQATMVRVLQPACLCIYGGRGMEGEGAPTDNLSVMTIDGREVEGRLALDCKWTASVKAKTGGHASCASSPTPSGLYLLGYGGLQTSGELAPPEKLLVCDGRNGVTAAHLQAAMEAGASTGLSTIPALDPSSWTWSTMALTPGQGADEDEQDLPLRFAAGAACFAPSPVAESQGSSPAQAATTFVVFGGMTVLEDSSQAVVMTVPLG